MANWEEDPAEARAKDNKQSRKADKILTKFFKEHEGRPVKQGYAYDKLVSLFNDKDTVCHWAFYEWIDKQIREGKLVREPVYKTEIVGYNLTYNGDETE